MARVVSPSTTLQMGRNLSTHASSSHSSPTGQSPLRRTYGMWVCSRMTMAVGAMLSLPGLGGGTGLRADPDKVDGVFVGGGAQAEVARCNGGDKERAVEI